MAATNKVYVGDIGTIIYVDVKETITSATVLQLKVKKPDEIEYTWAASLEGTTKLKYVAISGDFNQEGIYYLQAYVELPSWKGRGETVSFRVYDTYEI